jgi:hypothetical protein
MQEKGSASAAGHAEMSGAPRPSLDDTALTAAHKAVEDVLIEFRDERISVLNRGNGFVVCEKDGRESPIIRLGTREGLAIGISAYLEALEKR